MDSKEISSLPKSDVQALAAGEPLHMDKFSRNERLYRHLLEIGAVVEPIYSDFSMRHIDYLKVSATVLEH